MTCTFFGHRDCNSLIVTKLDKAIEELITKQRVDTFYVGNHGQFDSLVADTLRRAKINHPNIKAYIILAYMPTDRKDFGDFESILPDGIEFVPKRYAISYRNQWMITHSEYVITYVTRRFGGAYQFSEMAKRKGKTCINLE